MGNKTSFPGLREKPWERGWWVNWNFTSKGRLHQAVRLYETKGGDFPAPCLLDTSDGDVAGAACHQTWSDLLSAGHESAAIVTKSMFAQELEKISSEVKILNDKRHK